jgi:translation initiation factor 1
MPETCPKCGLPRELCTCSVIEQEEQKIRVFVEPRRFGKNATIVEGIPDRENAKQLASKLKSRLACGGTFKNGRIELQGVHKAKMKDLLTSLGYDESQIEIV